jgi:Ribosomal protein L7/L12 C-terminal domain
LSDQEDMFNVILEAAGANRPLVIKEVRALTSLGLKAAKDLVDSAPNVVLEQVVKELADKAKARLEGAGATVTVIVTGQTHRSTTISSLASNTNHSVTPCRWHQDLEPDAAGAPVPNRGVRPAARRLPRPSTNAVVATKAGLDLGGQLADGEVDAEQLRALLQRSRDYRRSIGHVPRPRPVFLYLARRLRHR